MKYKDIDQAYTNLVLKYMTMGYTINSSTMPGSQGEIASIDLEKDGAIVRLLITSFMESGGSYLQGVEIIEGKVVENIKPHTQRDQTIWNNRLEVISRQRYYEVGEARTREKFYGNRVSAERANQVRFERWRTNKESKAQDLTKEGKEIAKRIVRKRFNVKRIQEGAIKVYRDNGAYFVAYKNIAYKLH